MCPTDVCFPSHSLRAPAPRALPEPSRGSGEVGVSRRQTRFGGRKSHRRGAFSSPRRACHRASGAPVAPLVRPASLSESADLPRSAKVGSATSLVKGAWRLRPGAPSVDQWRAPHAARAIVSDPRETELTRCRSRDLAITTRRSALLHSHELTAVASRRASAHAWSLGSVDASRASVRKDSTRAFLSQAPPSTSATLTTREHTLASVRSSSEQETAVPRSYVPLEYPSSATSHAVP
jgi:hypothetical protein